MRSIEVALSVRISRRNETFRVDGAKLPAGQAMRLLHMLYERAGRPIAGEQVQLAIVEVLHESQPARTAARQEAEPVAPDLALRTRRADLAGRTPNQLTYLRNILSHDITFGIGPAGPERPDQRPYLEYGVQPGSVVLDHVAVVNQSDVPLTLAVYPGDAINSEGGGLDITQRAQRNQDLGSWVTLGRAVASSTPDPTSRSQTTVTVPPQSARTGRGTVIVPVRIAVPADAGPGDHVGGIATALLSRGANPTSQNIDLEQRVVTRAHAIIDRCGDRLDVTAARIAAVDPAVQLARGWSITRRADGTVVRSVDDLAVDDTITTALADGAVTSTVTATTHISSSSNSSDDTRNRRTDP